MYMVSEDHNSRPLQKLGEWDVNDPARLEVAIGAAGNGYQ
jgi:hypothetical protein